MPRWTPFEPYFWSLVRKGDGCWEWQGDRWGKGYGRITRGQRRETAHRVAYELAIGPITEGALVCHRCDNKLCVRPDHLFLGTQSDNMQDWTKKGKNRLANDRSLWSMGRHFSDPAARAKVSASMRSQFADGKRRTLRDANGRFKGTVCRAT